jgi:hypothetical protein
MRRQGHVCLTLSMRTSGSKVNAGHSGRSGGDYRSIAVGQGQCGCCTLPLHRRGRACRLSVKLSGHLSVGPAQGEVLRDLSQRIPW